MSRIGLVALSLWLFSALAASAQVRVTVSAQQYTAQEQIQAKIENSSARPITICIEIGQSSPTGAGTEPTPSPFSVEQMDEGKWHTLLLGPDVGSLRHAEDLGAGKSLVFPFRLGARGKMRLRLDYWLGSRPDLNCTVPPQDVKQVTSTAFRVE